MKIKNEILLKPAAQGVCLLLLAFTVSLFISAETANAWIITNSALLLFAVGNPIIGIFTKKWARYIGISLATFATLTIALYYLAHINCTKPLAEITQYKSVLITLVVFYLMLLSISALFRMVIYTLEGKEL
jgi:inner membrane protein involved in colicin E2 resistance